MPPLRPESSTSRPNEPFMERLRNELVRNTQRYFVIVIALEALVIAAVGWWFVIRPVWEQSSEELSVQQTENEDISRQVRAHDDRIIALSETIERYRRISAEDRATLLRVVPTAPDKETLFAALHSMVNRNGLAVGSITITGDAAQAAVDEDTALSEGTEENATGLPAGVAALDVSLDVSMLSYEGLKALLRTFERHERLLDVQNVSFMPEGNVGNFTLRAYYRPRSASNTAAAETAEGGTAR